MRTFDNVFHVIFTLWLFQSRPLQVAQKIIVRFQFLKHCQRCRSRAQPPSFLQVNWTNQGGRLDICIQPLKRTLETHHDRAQEIYEQINLFVHFLTSMSKNKVTSKPRNSLIASSILHNNDSKKKWRHLSCDTCLVLSFTCQSLSIS